MSPDNPDVYRGDTITFTATDQSGNSVLCNWYDNDELLVQSSSSTFTYTVPSNSDYGTTSFYARYVTDESIRTTANCFVLPRTMVISPATADITVGDSVTFTSSDGQGTNIYQTVWYINDELQTSSQMNSTATFSFDTVGTYTVKGMVVFHENVYATSTVTVTNNSGTDPDPEPSESPESSGDWVTNSQMDASQSSQTSTIIASIESESTIIQNAIQSLETTLSNSRIYDLFTQSFVYYDFDFTTGKLSTTGTTFDGFIPTFNHWAQNVEKYLGMLVDVRASEVEEEVKEESSGFWDILLGLFKPKDNGDKATANTDDMNTIIGIGDDVQGYFSSGGSIGDIGTIINDDSTWSWFSNDIAADIDSVPSTYSRSAPVIIDYYSKVYSDFYSDVLGRDWSGS